MEQFPWCSWSLTLIHDIASTFINQRNNPHLRIPATPFTPPTPSTFIEKFIPSSHSSTLLTLSSNFSSYTYLEFYTNGSLINLGHPVLRMGLAWLQTAPTAHLLSYSSAFTASSPSSSVAELAAIFTAILVAS